MCFDEVIVKVIFCDHVHRHERKTIIKNIKVSIILSRTFSFVFL